MLSKYYAKIEHASLHRLIRPYLLLACVFGFYSKANAELTSRPLEHNGYSRPYLLYRPAHMGAHPSVVIMLGGIGSTSQYEAHNFGWMQKAECDGFLTVFPEPVATKPDLPADRKNNVTFWEMQGSRTHVPGPDKLHVDDDGYLLAVIRDVKRRDHADTRRIFLAGFSSGSGIAQLFAARHPREVGGVVAVATPLMDPPKKLARPVPILYIHGDDDEQFAGFEVNSPHFATTPHGNWLTWGYLDGCTQQTARKTPWGVQFVWRGCKHNVPVTADFIRHLGHEWAGSRDAHTEQRYWPDGPLNFTEMAWQFFAGIVSQTKPLP